MKKNPGKWAFIGGMPVEGETSIEGAIREVKEEMGIELYANDMELLITFRREHDFVDVWIAKNNTKIEDITLQESEVDEAKWVTLQKLENMMAEGEVVPSINLYYELLKKLLYKCYFNLEI